MGQETPGCLGAIFRIFGLGAASPPEAETSVMRMDVYRVRDDFLSAAEASFFRVLRLTVGESYLICPKVRLADLFYVARPHENRGATNRIAQRHVDFLLCDPATLKPLAGLELDDASHRKGANAERDRFKDDVFAAAGLPLIRVPVQHAYEPAQITSLLTQALHQDPPVIRPEAAISPVVAAEQAASDPPLCPKCAVPMKLRTAQRGDNQGNSFWGCTNYPKCRQVVTASGSD